VVSVTDGVMARINDVLEDAGTINSSDAAPVLSSRNDPVGLRDIIYTLHEVAEGEKNPFRSLYHTIYLVQMRRKRGAVTAHIERGDRTGQALGSGYK
jgi:hypothetical protein